MTCSCFGRRGRRTPGHCWEALAGSGAGDIGSATWLSLALAAQSVASRGRRRSCTGGGFRAIRDVQIPTICSGRRVHSFSSTVSEAKVLTLCLAYVTMTTLSDNVIMPIERNRLGSAGGCGTYSIQTIPSLGV